MPAADAKIEMEAGMVRWILLIALLLMLPCCAWAQDGDDFFAMDEEDIDAMKELKEEEANENPQQQEWLKTLNKIRGKDDEEEKKRSEIWNEFEDISGTKAEKAYLNSREVTINRELSKPLPKQSPFGNRIDELEDAVNSLRAPNISGTQTESK